MTLPRAIKLIDRHVSLRGAETVLDYGCGDQAAKPHFERLGYAYAGWDITDEYSAPCKADLVNLCYVLNVLPLEMERKAVLKRAFGLANSALLITLPPGFVLSQAEQFAPLDRLNDVRGTVASLTAENLSWIETETSVEVVPLSSDVFLCLKGARADVAVTHRPTGIMSTIPALAKGLLSTQSRRSFMGRVAAITGGVFALGVGSKPAQASDVHARVTQVLIDQLGVSSFDVQPGSKLVEDLGADSLDKVELGMALEDEFGDSIADEDFDQMETVQDIVNYFSGMGY